MMAGMYSDVDFNRMQEQLLQLREASYKSDERCRGQEKELNNLKENLSILEKELNKANQIINRSKRAKDYEAALNEVDSLQRKLHIHEEDSRLQNETLMKELAQLVGTNERLEKELRDRKEREDGNGGENGGGGYGEMVKKGDHQALQDELRRLHAQYSALLKCNRGQTEKLPSSSSSSSLPAGQIELVSNNCNNSEVETASSNENIPVDQNIEDLRLKLETEKEENNLLKQQLQQLELKFKEELSLLKQENVHLSEKLRKKQESLLQLQEAKDKLFTDMSSKLETVRVEHDKSLKESQEKFNQESVTLIENKKSLEDDVIRLKKKFNELLNEKKRLEEQMVARGEESSEKLKDLQLEFEAKIKKQADIVGAFKEKVENLRVQLKESQASHQQSTEENAALKVDKEKLALKFIEITKVADKRKSLLDQLAMKYQEDSDQHREQLKEVKKNHESIVNDLNHELSQLKVQVKELKVLEEDCECLKEKLKNLENFKSLLEQSLNDAQNDLKSTKEENENRVSELILSYDSQITHIEKEHCDKIQEFEKRLTGKEAEIKELNEVIVKYEQMVKDHEEDKKLHEKKGSTVVKDLKKQLHSERKRAEKLQEKLQEILSEPKNRTSVEDLLRPLDERLKSTGDNRLFTDTSSLSSWSPSGLSRDNLMSQGTDEESSDTTLRQENDVLVRRIGELLLKVSTLEEKVSHLESSNASMAEDLLQKTAVIDHYHMDSRPATVPQSSHSNDNKMSLKRVVDFVTDKNDDRRQDMNKRLQRMLEETLTKNMHLQNDLERLSKELSDLKTNHQGHS